MSVTTLLAGVDALARALGMPPVPLPDPRPGEPTRHRPACAKPGTAWVAMIAPEDASGPEADVYAGAAFVPNILRAMSLVPDAVRTHRQLSDALYIPLGEMLNPNAGREIDRLQIELVAARVSALNECFY